MKRYLIEISNNLVELQTFIHLLMTIKNPNYKTPGKHSLRRVKPAPPKKGAGSMRLNSASE